MKVLLPLLPLKLRTCDPVPPMKVLLPALSLSVSVPVPPISVSPNPVPVHDPLPEAVIGRPPVRFIVEPSPNTSVCTPEPGP